MSKTVVKPTSLEMIVEAVRELKERRGSSVMAIKNYIVAKYKREKGNQFNGSIKRALKKGQTSGVLVRQNKSDEVGDAAKPKATGRFKLGANAVKKPKVAPKKKPVAKKPAAKKPAPKKTGKSPAKKTTKAKKPASAAKKPAKKTAKKTPTKVKKVTKKPTPGKKKPTAKKSKAAAKKPAKK